MNRKDKDLEMLKIILMDYGITIGTRLAKRIGYNNPVGFEHKAYEVDKGEGLPLVALQKKVYKSFYDIIVELKKR